MVAKILGQYRQRHRDNLRIQVGQNNGDGLRMFFLRMVISEQFMIFQKSWFNKTLLVVLFFLIISLILILSWFKDGHFYGGLDVGLPTYNPQKVFEMAKYIWWDNVAPGFLIPHVITSISLYFFLSFLQFLGIGSVGIQAILFYILLFFPSFLWW